MYRIVKKYFRSEDDGDVYYYYIIEKLVKVFSYLRLKNIEKWKPLNETYYGFYGKCSNVRRFYNLRYANKFLDNIKKNIPRDCFISGKISD